MAPAVQFGAKGVVRGNGKASLQNVAVLLSPFYRLKIQGSIIVLHILSFRILLPMSQSFKKKIGVPTSCLLTTILPSHLMRRISIIHPFPHLFKPVTSSYPLKSYASIDASHLEALLFPSQPSSFMQVRMSK